MKSRPAKSIQSTDRQSELLILADGTLLAHNLTPMMARVLAELHAGDRTTVRRANAKGKVRDMNFQAELETLIRARYPILYVISSEEMRVQNAIVEIASKAPEKSL